MRLAVAPALSISVLVLLGACAARAARPEHPKPSDGAPAASQATHYREMTWAEYYTDVMERASKRGVTVVWVNPPPVRPPDRPAADKLEPNGQSGRR
jgi:hypothetical protein